MERTDTREWSGFGHFILRWAVGIIVLAITAFFTPGFAISSFFSLFIAALAIALLDWIIIRFTGIDATPYGRGIVGFILAAVIIYVVKFIVPGYNITIVSALIAAVVYGIVDAIIPGRAM